MLSDLLLQNYNQTREYIIKILLEKTEYNKTQLSNMNFEELINILKEVEEIDNEGA